MIERVNIVLVEYINRNLGDTAIAECARVFLEEALKRAGIENYCIQEYNMYSEDMEFIRHADVIIFAGGGLIKYKRENFYKYVPDIIEVAGKYDIPVYFNCVGVEGYDETDDRCLRLKHAINQTCVKGMTVRDDFNVLSEDYLEDKKEWLDKVLDPAAFSSEAYQCKGRKSEGKIGLGIAHDHLFKDYGLPFITREFLLDFWKGIIEGLQREGYQWEIFTNGLYEDYKFALEILEYVGTKEKERYLVRRPVEGRELAKTISNYEGVIAVRLHANIIAFSMGVSSIGLVWNEKMLRWGEVSGYPERLISAEDIEVNKVLGTLESALKKGCRNCTQEEREQILTPLAEFLRKYGKPSQKNKLYLSRQTFKAGWENILVANALGGKNFQYNGMNSPETIFDKYKDGFRWFEADVKLTSDGIPVCVNGWTRLSRTKLGIRDTELDKWEHGITYREFMSLRYYDGHYDVMDYQMLIDYLRHMPDARMILDVRYSTHSEMQIIATFTHKNLQEDPGLKNRMIFRVTDWECMEAVKILGLKVMFDFPPEKEMRIRGMNDAEVIRNCREESVEWISVRKQICTEEQIKQLKQYKKKICALSHYNTLSKIKELLSWGVDMVGTDYQSVEGLNCLSK